MAKGSDRTFRVFFDADTGELKVEANKAADALDRIDKSASTAKSPLSDISKIAGGFIVAQGLMQLPGVLSGAVGAASDLAESQSKVNVVFGQFAPPIHEWAETANAIGLSDGAAEAAAGTFGNLFVAMGLSQTAAADMSMDVVGLAADLASFNNIEIQDALEKLRAGLVGEAEPLRALGVNINAAAVEAKALEMGLAATKGEIEESDKVMARYKLILEQTGTAQGDFERTSDGLANKQRILKADIADLQAEIGEKLVPAFDAGVTAAQGMVGLADDIPFSTAAVATLGATAVLMAPKVLELASSFDVSRQKGTLLKDTLGSTAGQLTIAAAGFAALDLGVRALTDKGILEHVASLFNEGAEAANRAQKAAEDFFDSLPEQADKPAETLAEINRQVSEFYKTGRELAKELPTFFKGVDVADLDQLRDRLMDIKDGGAAMPTVGREFNEASAEITALAGVLATQLPQGAEAAAERAKTLYDLATSLDPAFRAAFEAGVDWAQVLGQIGADAAQYDTAMMDFAIHVTEAGAATEANIDPLSRYGDEVNANKDGVKDWNQAVKDLIVTLTTNDQQYLGIKANMALVKDEINDLKAKGDDLTAAERDRLTVLEGTLENLEKAKGAYDSNAEALNALTASVQTYVGPDVARALLRSMQDAEQPTDTMVEKFGGLQRVYDNLSTDNIPGAIDALGDLKDEMTDEEWAIASKTVGEDIVDGIEDGVSDPAQRQNLLTELETTVGIATSGAKDNAALDGAEVGAAIATGTAKGITDNKAAISSALEDAAGQALDGVKRMLGIKSPSTVSAEEVGKPTAQGIGAGFVQEMTEAVIPDMIRAVASSINAMDDVARTKLYEAINDPGSPYKALSEYGYTVFEDGSVLAPSTEGGVAFGVTDADVQAWIDAANAAGGIDPTLKPGDAIHGQAAQGQTFKGQQIPEGVYDPSANGGRGAWFYDGAWHMSPPDAGYGVEGNGFGKGSGIINGDDYPIPFGEMLNGEPAIDMNQLRARYEAMGLSLTDEELAERARGMLDQDYMSLAFGASDYVGGSYLDYHLGKQLLGYDIMGGGLSKYAKGGTAARGAAVPHGSNRGGGGSPIVVVINVQGSIVGPEQFITDVVKRKFSRLLG